MLFLELSQKKLILIVIQEEKERDQCMCLYIHAGGGAAPTGVRLLGISEFASLDGMSLKFNSKPCFEICLFGQNSPLMASEKQKKGTHNSGNEKAQGSPLYGPSTLLVAE